MKRNRRGQTAVEYTVLFILVIGALIGMQTYFKRGLSGRWKASLDELGDQYDPRTANTHVIEQMTSSTNTEIMVGNTTGGYWTKRTDESSSKETKTGRAAVGAY